MAGAQHSVDGSGAQQDYGGANEIAHLPTPFPDKVWACAQVEKRTEKEADVLVWVNPESLIVAPPRELDLPPAEAAAFRPVDVQNVGLSFGVPPDAFWAGIYKAAGLSVDQAFPVESFAEGRRIHADAAGPARLAGIAAERTQ